MFRFVSLAIVVLRLGIINATPLTPGTFVMVKEPHLSHGTLHYAIGEMDDDENPLFLPMTSDVSGPHYPGNHLGGLHFQLQTVRVRPATIYPVPHPAPDQDQLKEVQQALKLSNEELKAATYQADVAAKAYALLGKAQNVNPPPTSYIATLRSVANSHEAAALFHNRRRNAIRKYNPDEFKVAQESANAAYDASKTLSQTFLHSVQRDCYRRLEMLPDAQQEHGIVQQTFCQGLAQSRQALHKVKLTTPHNAPFHVS